MTPNPKLLEDAGRIVRGETMMLATGEHLAAVVDLVQRAQRIISQGTDDPDVWDRTEEWLRSAEPLLGARA